MINKLDKSYELKALNFTKIVLMIIIVFYHSMCFFTPSWFNQDPVYPSSLIPKIAAYLNTFHIYAFTLISGYIFYFLKQEKHKYNSFDALLKNKFKRLIVPYIFVALLWVMPFYIHYFGFDFRLLVNKYVLGIAPSQLWFLLMLFWVFILAEILWNPLTKNFVSGLILVLCIYLLGFQSKLYIDNYYQIFTAFQYLIYFWFGMMLRKYNFNFLRNISSTIYVLLDVLLFLLIDKFGIYIATNTLLYIVINISVKLFGAIMAFMVFNRLSVMFNLNSNILKTLGLYLMPIYLFHQQIIYCLIDIFNGFFHPFTMVFVCAILALVLSLTLSALLNKNTITRKIIGFK